MATAKRKVAEAEPTLEDLFAAAGRHMLAAHPKDAWGRMLHAPAITTGGKCFAFLTSSGLVVKLPEDRVVTLIAAGEGRPLDIGKGRPMREWVRLAPADERACIAYMTEARTFVRALAKR